MIIKTVYSSHTISVRRLARTFQEPVSTVGRWIITPQGCKPAKQRHRPVCDNPSIRERILYLCNQPRHLKYGYRYIWALLRRDGIVINKKSVWRIMHEMNLTRPKVWHKPYRPKRVEKMRPVRPNQNWQIDMTSFALSDFTALYLVLIIDCYSRKIVGWTLNRRCRAGEWIGALRTALESEGLMTKQDCNDLALRSDNGSQPCSKKFVEYLGQTGVRGQYTGYNAPDDNAYVERVIRTVKEEEIWPNMYDTVWEASAAVGDYINYYNQERLHSALDYKTPNQITAAYNTLVAA